MKKNLYREIYLLLLHLTMSGWYFFNSLINNQPINGSPTVFFLAIMLTQILMFVDLKRKFTYLQLINVFDGFVIVMLVIFLISGLFELIAIFIGFAIFTPAFIFGLQIQKEMTKK